jgi:hypothetical protein
MRPSRALLLALLWAPLGLQARILVEGGPYSLGDGGADALPAAEAKDLRRSIELPFSLSVAAEVQAQAEGLRYLHDAPDAAPEAFIDDQYLGPLLGAHGQTWRSSRSLHLEAGPHRFILRNAAVADAEDFVLKRIFVYASGPPEAPASGAPKGPRPTPVPTVENGCTWRETRAWPERIKNGLTLSVLSDRVSTTGELVRLLPGDAWECYLKLPAPQGQPLALVATFRPPASGKGPCRWVFSLDLEPPDGVEALGYHPGLWERLHAKLCNGRLSLQFAQAPPVDFPWPKDSLSLEIAAQGVEIALRPAD